MDEVERLKQFFMEIHMNEGKVCPGFETCKHPACSSNHRVWEMADAALQGMTLEQYRGHAAQVVVELAKLGNGELLAIFIQCFKCGAYIVVKASEHPQCKCGSKDVVLITEDRTPEGHINNCALAGGYEESMCQMCGQGPCPEAVKFRSHAG
jgi:hypothetical protein